MRKTYCDHCGKTVDYDELTRYRHDKSVDYEVVVEGKFNHGYGRDTMDLCKDCQMAIDQLIANYLNNKAVSAP